ncbi:protein-tyrosine phosphatase [Lactobacillus colini]|uniref:Protein-tyrosine phosphatase n=1 Tax=Lactobacillus colini TaxID=1819254 RepID=A0ABS4MGJ9_9LACO|nr:tyrosine-protein phosphatase [Lactobacillus colini]MBP2058823.1 protein-tyrosine phosphatase [Lactobacillus colini]
MKHDRLITLDGTVNFRDLGGYRNKDGQHLKWNKIYRADSLSSLSANDEAKLEEMRVTIDCDLRSTNEQAMAPDQLWDGVQYIDCHLYAETRDGSFAKEKDRAVYKFLHHIPKINGTNNFLGEIYQNVILSPASQAAFAKVFANLLTLPEDEGLVFHCSAGKDRTGMTAALLLTALGVDDKTISQDYLLTNQLYSFGLKKQIPSDSEMINLVNRMNVTQGEGTAIKGVTQTINEGFGGFDKYFIKVLGFSKEDLTRLRELYLE